MQCWCTGKQAERSEQQLEQCNNGTGFLRLNSIKCLSVNKKLWDGGRQRFQLLEKLETVSGCFPTGMHSLSNFLQVSHCSVLLYSVFREH